MKRVGFKPAVKDASGESAEEDDVKGESEIERLMRLTE